MPNGDDQRRDKDRKGCTVTIVPFDCRRKTCECDPLGDINEAVSENYLIRYDNRPVATGADKLRLIFKNTLDCDGDLTVTRFGQQISQTNVECKPRRQCLVAIDSAVVNRPPIRMEDGTGVMTPGEAFQRLQAWGSPQNPIPDVRPYTNREQYRLEVKCCGGMCSDVLEATGWDCDLIILAYQMLYSMGVSTGGIMLGIDTVRQFFASMAIRGAKALCDLYRQSAVMCDRPFQDVNAAIALSAVLAEETWVAQVQHFRGQPMSANWQAYYNEPNALMGQIDLFTFERHADLFGAAHLKDGLIKAFTALGPSPCRAHDLDVVVETLTRIQAPHLLQNVGAIAGSMIGNRVADEFRGKMRQGMLDALRQAGDTSTAATLSQQWNMP